MQARSRLGPFPLHLPGLPQLRLPRGGRLLSPLRGKRLLPEDLRLSALFREAGHELFHLEGRLARTLLTLLRRPGELTVAWREGRRTAYTRPLPLFVAINLLFFLFLSGGMMTWSFDSFHHPDQPTASTRILQELLSRSGQSLEVLRARFDMTFTLAKKSYLFLALTPLLALGVGLLQIRRRQLAAVHVVFAVHSSAFLLAWLGVGSRLVYVLILFPLAWLAGWLSGRPELAGLVDGEPLLLLLMAAGLVPYLTFSLGRVYGDSWPWALCKATALWLLILAGILLLSKALFHYTVWQLR